MNPINLISPFSIKSVLKNTGRSFLIALVLTFSTNYDLKAQKNGNGNANSGSQCNPNSPHYDPCLCGDPCNEVPLDSWAIYLVGGVIVIGFFRLKNQSFTINKIT